MTDQYDPRAFCKPCPFCGIPAEIYRRGGGPGWYVHHWNRGVDCPIDNFDSYQGTYGTQDEALAAWNERLVLEVPRAVIRASSEAGKLSGTTEEIELLAEYAHYSWTGWMGYLFSKCQDGQDGAMVIPANWVKRWKRQMQTEYSALPDDHQDSDREEARAILFVIRNKIMDWQG